MRVGVDYGRKHVDLEVPEGRLVEVHRQPPAAPLADPVAAVREALEHPHDFPALRRALTPDDHVAVAVDDGIPRLAELLPPLLDHLISGGVRHEAITLIWPASRPAGWTMALPDSYRRVHQEVHDPADRKHLAYLATTRHDRRVYLNRTAVDADQLVVFARRRYDPLLGYSGAEGAIFPTLADEATRQEMCRRLTLAPPGEHPWPTRQEATEIAWLLGAPFLVQVIEGAGDEIIHVVAGVSETTAEGQRLLDARWRVTAEQPADIVLGSIGGDPARQDFGELARAMANAARVVKPDGRIVLLSNARPELGPGAEFLRQSGDPGQALGLLRKKTPADAAEAFLWASTVQQARVYLLSDLPAEIAEELFITPLDSAEQAQRLIGGDGTCLFLADAHKTLAVTARNPNGHDEDV
jgi:nickel-dependent lactate racemase